MKKLLICVVLALLVGGCVKGTDSEGNTTWRLDLGKAGQVEQGAEGAAGILNIIGAYWPPAGAAGLTLLTALGIWKKKIKPNYEKAKTDANLYHTTAHTIIAAIEELKKTDPAAWKKLEKELGPMSIHLENVIRGMRGLPVK